MAKANDRTTERKVDLPIFGREAAFRAETFNEADNTIEVVWAAGARVRRYSWRDEIYYEEVLEMTPEAVRLERLNAGAPFLNSHRQWSVEDVLGSVVPGTARIANGKGFARVQLSRAEKDADTVQKIRDGVIRNISVGYFLHRVQKTTPTEENGLPEWRAIDWEPFEISAVPVPADPGAQVRGAPSEGERMFPCIITETETRKAAAAAETKEDDDMAKTDEAAAQARGNEPAVTDPAIAPVTEVRAAPPSIEDGSLARAAKAAVDEAVRAERERSATIVSLADSVGLRSFGEEHAAKDTSVEAFRGFLIDAVAERNRQPPVITSIGATAHVGESDPARRAAAIENMLLHRSDRSIELTTDGRDFRGLSLIDLAREHLSVRGVNTRGMSRLEIAQAALEANARSGGLHTTSDFSVILSGVVNKTLRRAYEAAPQTFRPLVRVVSVSDFKAVTRAQLGEAPSLEKVNEHGEFTRGSIGDAGESYKVETFGRIVGVTRQVIVNDDLEALTRLPRMFGMQAAQLESDLVWAQILGNYAMADGKALFHADHGNLATATGNIDVAKVSAGRVAMSKQTGLDGETVLNIRPSFLLVPTELETDAEKFVNQIYATKVADVVPASLKSLTPISEPRLSSGIPSAKLAGSASSWYLAADPNQIDTIELAYLEGHQGVYTETRQGFDIDGVEIKVRLDVGAKAIDHRGFYKVPGQ